jgi:hypothetical protein
VCGLSAARATGLMQTAGESGSLARRARLKLPAFGSHEMLVFSALNRVTASVAHFVSFEVGNLIETLSRLGSVATVWPGALIAVFGMETVIYVAVEALMAVKPGANANEHATAKPLRAVIAIGSAIVRRHVIVAVGTYRLNTDVDLY